MTKSQLIRNLVSDTGLTKAQVETVMGSLKDACHSALLAGDKFEIPGIARLKVVKKPATAATKRMNPFTKQMQDVPAKPESKKVKAAPVKELKDAVQ